MAELDASWEYYVADPEVAELVGEHNEVVVRAARNCSPARNKEFLFAFAGDRTMSSGRFFDGIGFGKAPAPWFLWNIGRRSSEFLLRLFEESLADVDSANRMDYLATAFCRAWDKLPGRQLGVLTRLLAWEPDPAELRRPGRRVGPIRAIAEQLGRTWSGVQRDYLRAKWSLLGECIPEDRKPKCQCGCGSVVSIAYVWNKACGHEVGRPVRFITGHGAILAAAQKPAALARCPHCHSRHRLPCPLIRSVEYHENGQVKRVEYHDRRTA